MKHLGFLLLTFTLLFTACGDDDDIAVPITIEGTWKAKTGSFENAEYLIFTPDNTLKAYSEEDGFNQVFTVQLETVTDKEFSYSGGGLVEVDYVIVGNELRLNSFGTETVYTRDSSFDPQSWAKEVSASGGFPLPTGAYGADPGFSPTENVFYYADGRGIDRFYKLNPSGTISSSAPITHTASTVVAWSGGPVVSNNGSSKVFLINSISGAEIDSSPDMGAWIKGIAWDGGDLLYCVSNNEQKVYAFNTDTNAVDEIGSISFGPTGAHYRDANIYITSFNMIYKIRLSDFTVTDTYVFDTSEGALSGITHDGSTFWVSVEKHTSSAREAYLKPITLN